MVSASPTWWITRGDSFSTAASFIITIISLSLVLDFLYVSHIFSLYHYLCFWCKKHWGTWLYGLSLMDIWYGLLSVWYNIFYSCVNQFECMDFFLNYFNGNGTSWILVNSLVSWLISWTWFTLEFWKDPLLNFFLFPNDFGYVILRGSFNLRDEILSTPSTLSFYLIGLSKKI